MIVCFRSCGAKEVEKQENIRAHGGVGWIKLGVSGRDMDEVGCIWRGFVCTSIYGVPGQEKLLGKVGKQYGLRR